MMSPRFASRAETTSSACCAIEAAFVASATSAGSASPRSAANSSLASCKVSRGPLALRFAALLIATALVDPHLYAYDLVLLVPAFLLLWDWVLGEPDRPFGRYRFNSVFIWLLYLCYLSPLFVTLADVARIQLSPLLLSLLGFVILGILRGGAWRATAAV